MFRLHSFNSNSEGLWVIVFFTECNSLIKLLLFFSMILLIINSIFLENHRCTQFMLSWVSTMSYKLSSHLYGKYNKWK